LEAIAAGAAGMKDHDRWLLARKQLEASSRAAVQLKAARFVELILARPIASAG